MFRYYLALGFRSLRRNPVLTALMVLTLSIGVAASMTSLTLLHGMSGDPIPHKSDRLFVPQIDNQPADATDVGTEPPEQLTYMDTMRLWEQAHGKRQTPVLGIAAAIDSGRPQVPPFFGDGIAIGRDFFAMFDVPFLYGQPWSVQDDQSARRVVVISRALSERVFGDHVNPVGKSLRIDNDPFTIAGVIDTWKPVPKFYRIVGSSSFGDHEAVFMPMRTAIAVEPSINGNINCSSSPPEPGFKGYLLSECNWFQFWVELDSAADRQAYLNYLGAYVAEQKSLGRFARPTNNRLRNVREWLDFIGVVSDDSKTSAWLAFGFLLVCLVNTVGLLLAKFSGRPGEIGVRRALGATRREIFQQYLTEAGVIGLVGAGLGIALTLASLAYIRNFDHSLDLLARLDTGMATLAIALSLAAALLAGLLPTWRACQVMPAIQLKSQ